MIFAIGCRKSVQAFIRGDKFTSFVDFPGSAIIISETTQRILAQGTVSWMTLEAHGRKIGVNHLQLRTLQDGMRVFFYQFPSKIVESKDEGKDEVAEAYERLFREKTGVPGALKK
jgi:hypothetical protein